MRIKLSGVRGPWMVCGRETVLLRSAGGVCERRVCEALCNCCYGGVRGGGSLRVIAVGWLWLCV